MRLLRLHGHQGSLHYAIQPRLHLEGQGRSPLDHWRRTSPVTHGAHVFLSPEEHQQLLQACYERQITLCRELVITNPQSEEVFLEDLATQGTLARRAGLSLILEPLAASNPQAYSLQSPHNNKAVEGHALIQTGNDLPTFPTASTS